MYHNCLIWLGIWGFRSWGGIQSPLATVIHSEAPVVTGATVNPPQIDAPPVVITAATGVPLAELGDLIDNNQAASTLQQRQPNEPQGPRTSAALPGPQAGNAPPQQSTATYGGSSSSGGGAPTATSSLTTGGLPVSKGP